MGTFKTVIPPEDLPPGRKNGTGLEVTLFLFGNLVKQIVQTIIDFLKVYTEIEIGGNSVLAYFFRPVECTGGDSTPGPIIRREILPRARWFYAGATLCYNTGKYEYNCIENVMVITLRKVLIFKTLENTKAIWAF